MLPEPAEVDLLVERARSGDEGAFTAIVERTQWAVRAWVHCRCPPGIDADEIAHTTYIECFKRLEEYRPGGGLVAWLRTIARYRIMAELTRIQRQQQNRARCLPELLRAELERQAADVDERDERRLEALRRCLEGLQAAPRALLDGHYRDGRPLAEIAGAVGRSVAAIKKALFQLRRRLQDCIEQRLSGTLP